VAQRETAAMEAVFREFAAERLRIREEAPSDLKRPIFARVNKPLCAYTSFFMHVDRRGA